MARRPDVPLPAVLQRAARPSEAENLHFDVSGSSMLMNDLSPEGRLRSHMSTPLACTPAKEVQPEQTTNTVPPEREIEADMMDTQEGEEEDDEEEEDLEQDLEQDVQPQQRPPPPHPEEDEEDEEMTTTTKAAMVRKELIDMNALAPNDISLSSFSESASEDGKVDWLRHLRRLTAELVKERGRLTPVKEAIAHLDKEGAEDVISLAAEAILVGRATTIFTTFIKQFRGRI
jgi:hypothetical protein